MKRKNIDRKTNRKRRHLRVLRKFIKIDNGLPRLVVIKTNLHIYAQLIDDEKGHTILSSSSLQLKLKNGNIDSAKKVGLDIAKKAIEKNITKINFDRNGFKYHGRVSALADAAREAGLKF